MNDEFKKVAVEVAADFIQNKATGIISEYRGMLDTLDPLQKEYVVRMAYLKSVNVSELDLEELIELDNMIVRANELGIKITEAISRFWESVWELVKEAAEKFTDVGIKVLSKTVSLSLLGLLL